MVGLFAQIFRQCFMHIAYSLSQACCECACRQIFRSTGQDLQSITGCAAAE
jgi:hypothetical protein